MMARETLDEARHGRSKPKLFGSASRVPQRWETTTTDIHRNINYVLNKEQGACAGIGLNNAISQQHTSTDKHSI